MTSSIRKSERKGGGSLAVGALCLALVALCGAPRSAQGETFHNALSLQGFTGIINTPNAAVADEGTMHLLYSNQEDRTLRQDTHQEESYLFNVGLFSIAELGGRLTNLPGSNTRDLSANFKVKVPFIPKEWPQVAFGIQDLGGGGSSNAPSALLRTKYVVGSHDLWRFRFSLGYGNGPDRMDGVFGGGELKVCDWLYLLGEYDTKDTNVALRVVAPEFFGIPVRLQATAKSAVNRAPGNIDLAVGLTFPLGLSRHNTAPAPADAVQGAEPPASPGAADGGGGQDPGAVGDVPDPAGDPRLSALGDKLAKGGFLNVRVGAKRDLLLVVEYENARYNHNELDALGVVAGLAVDTVPSGYRSLMLVMKKQGIRVVSFTASLPTFREFLHDAAALRDLDNELQIRYDVEEDPEVQFLPGTRASSYFRSSLVLSPGLSTVIGSDYGVFDYLLSLKADYYLNVWKGGQINARWDIPVAWSENYDDGKPLRNNRKGTRFERLMLFQNVKLAPTIMANVGGGQYLADTYGMVNEVMWTPGSGTHRFRVKQAYLKNTEVTGSNSKNEVYLGSYRYFFNPLDLYFEGTAGQFFNNDRGFTTELKRFFGDTAFSIYYKNTKGQDAGSERIQVGGVQFAFPLTPRRDMKPYPLQVRGSDEWFQSVETRIASTGTLNYFYDPLGINPQPFSRMEHLIFNRDRLSEPYLRSHLLRLRDAYLKYR